MHSDQRWDEMPGQVPDHYAHPSQLQLLHLPESRVRVRALPHQLTLSQKQLADAYQDLSQDERRQLAGYFYE